MNEPTEDMAVIENPAVPQLPGVPTIAVPVAQYMGVLMMLLARSKAKERIAATQNKNHWIHQARDNVVALQKVLAEAKTK